MKLYMLMIFAFIKGLFVRNKDNHVDFYPNEPLKLDLQFFADSGDGGDGAGAGDGGDGGDGTNGGSGSGDGVDSKDKPFAEFKTKDDFNKRLSRAEKAGQKALATSLGFDSVEAMQAAIKPPADTNKKPGDSGEPNIDEIVEEKLKGEREKTFKRLLNSEVKLVANKLEFADYEDALALADLSAVKEDDKGDLVGVEAALQALADKKPHLLKNTGGNNFGADVNNQKKRTEKERLEQIKKEAQSRGVSVSAANDPWKRN
ncbi:scaffolding protein [Planomicrobium sp. MB-3u-38]|uniref:scaffolding protein n=1 Tax=Planomicrobium sp. MB-3u-38 TaxID=2058318 RepID=UPI001E2E7A16|nr:scaffolding protein [Planomicrobium sp. MB-3u-38]